MNSLYFDHAATTRPHASVVASVLETLEENYANPSSLHRAGLRAERTVEEARHGIAAALFCEEEELVFTSGGTEANYLALAGVLKPGDRVLTTPLEHASIRVALESLSDAGIIFEQIPVTAGGHVDEKELELRLQSPVRLVSLQQVNNETGVIQDLEALVRRIHRVDRNILVHSDGIQGFGKFVSPLRKIPLDLYSVSAHKIGGLKGTGALYIRKNTPFRPVIKGGGQEGGRRGGTQNVPGIAAFGRAVREWEEHREEWTTHVLRLRKRLLEGLAAIPDTRVHSEPGGSPFVLSVGFKDCRGEVLLHMLEQKGLSVSTGSACAKGAVSRVLQELKIDENYAQGTVRISLGHDNTEASVDLLVLELAAGAAMIRKMTRRKR